MRRLLPLLLAFTAAPVLAQELGQQTTAMLYWQKPLGASEKRDAASSFGLRLDQTRTVNSVVFRKPIVDVRFNQRGFHSLGFRGMVMHQNQPASGESAPDINWWLVIGISAAAVAVIHDENKNSPTLPTPTKGGGS